MEMGAHKTTPLKKRTKRTKTVATVTSIKKDQSDEDLPATVGEHLQKTRKALKKRLSEVSKALRISETYLVAIEENRGRDLPERVYAVGFVRAYSHFLGLDSQAVTQRFCEEVLENPKKMDYHLPISYAPQKLPSQKLLKTCFFLTFFLVLGWLTFEQWTSALFKNETSDVAAHPLRPATKALKQTEQAEQKALTPEQQALEEEEPEIEEGVEALAQRLKNQKLSQKTTPSSSLTLDRQKGPAALRGIHQETKTAEDTGSPPSSYEPYYLLFLERSWIEVRRLSDSKVTLRKTFFPGEKQLLPSGEDLVIRIGNAGGVKLSDGVTQSDFMGEKGQVLSGISLAPASLAAYLK